MALDLDNLKEIRIERGLTQDDMAKKWVGKQERHMQKEKMVLLIQV